jgi:hypothetical protein
MKSIKFAVLAASVVATLALAACRCEEAAPLKLGAADIVDAR